jgi:murein DD-endopeptidase MepM/ murein hydrolase activator NlpD
VADGTVVVVRDDMLEETRLQPPGAVQHPANSAGNQIVIQTAGAVWSVYAHLQPGSISVGVGEQVATGQPLARLGNTGNSTAPTSTSSSRMAPTS